MAQSHYISNTNVRRREIEFEVDDWVYLNSSPMKGAMSLVTPCMLVFIEFPRGLRK